MDIVIIISHENRIFEIMNDTFGINLIKNNISYINNCDIFEIKNDVINYYINDAKSEKDCNNFIHNTSSTINFSNPIKFYYQKNNNINSNVTIFLMRHSYAWSNVINTIPDSDITDGKTYFNNVEIKSPDLVLYNGISLAKNTAINFYSYLKNNYDLSKSNIYYTCSELRRSQQTLYYFQEEINNSFKYDIFPNIIEITYGIYLVNKNKIIDKNSNDYRKIANYFYNSNKQSIIKSGRLDNNKNINWEFYNYYFSNKNNITYDLIYNVNLYLHYKIFWKNIFLL